MFETLEVKDPRVARDRYIELLSKEKAKFEKIEIGYIQSAGRKEMRIEELKNELKATKDELELAVSRDAFEKERKAHKTNVAKWEKGGEKSEEDVVWSKKGEGREWDRGKVLDDDGLVNVKPEWGRLKDS